MQKILRELVEKRAALQGKYRDATAGTHVKKLSEYQAAFDTEDQNMTNYMQRLMKQASIKLAVLSYGSAEGGAVGSQLTEFEINNNAFRKTKSMTGLPKGTDAGYRQSKTAMFKKAVQTLTLESEDPKFMERDYQQRSQNSRWLREVNRYSDSIMKQAALMDSDFRHIRKRAREKYNLELEKNTVHDWNSQIHAGKAKFVSKYHSTEFPNSLLYEIEHFGKKIRAIYRAPHKTIKTLIEGPATYSIGDVLREALASKALKARKL